MNQKFRITIGVILIILGIGLILSNYFIEKKYSAYERLKFEISNIPTEIENSNEEEITPDEELSDTVYIEEEKVFINDGNYIGRLEIPKINLEKGFVSKESSENNVNKNVAIIEPSSYPDKEKGNFILAAHNGNGYNSYFRNLHKLKNDDIAYVYYNGIKYTYKVTRIYQVDKTGTVNIYRDVNKTTLTLITCTKGDKKHQTVFILELQKQEKE